MAAVPDLPPVEAQNRFHFTLQDLLRALASKERSLVLVLDDLQWADGPSLRMLERVAADPAIGSLLLVGAYRDHEVDEGHPLTACLRALAQGGVDLEHIALGPLGAEDAARLVADALRVPAAEAAPLAELAHKKTGGNPFFLGQLLRALHERGHVRFVPERGAFAFDLEAATALDITDNVVDLLTAKLRRLPERTPRVLALAACIGVRFDLATLAVVASSSRVEAARDLWPALVEELVAPIGSDYKFVDESPGYNPSYRFVHDRVQQAAGELIPPDRLAETHLAIGRLMLAASPDAERDEALFEMWSHIQAGAALVLGRAERDRAAELGLAAGRRAMSAAAYAPAARFLTAGISFLDEDGWGRRYRLMLDLHTAATQATQLSGDIDAVDRLAGEVLDHARSLDEKLDVYEARVLARYERSRMAEGLAICLEVLECLGVRFPPKGKEGRHHVVAALVRAKLALAGKRPEDLDRLPALADPGAAAALRFLRLAGPGTFLSRPDVFPLEILAAVRISARGLNDESSYGFVGYGLMLAGHLGDVPLGYRYGQLSQRLARRPGLERHRCTADVTRLMFVEHWKTPLVETLPALEDASRLGLETGSFEYAFIGLAVHVTHSFYCGRPLAAAAEDAAAFASTSRRLGFEKRMHVITLLRQVIENLRVGPADPLVLDGTITDEESMRAAHEASGEVHIRCTLQIMKTLLGVHFGSYAAAGRHAAAAVPFEAGVAGTAVVPLFAFYRTLADLGPSGVEGATRSTLARTQKTLDKLRGWARHAPENQLHRALLIEAELARSKGERGGAADAYDRAIAAARDAGHLGEEALACERAGRFFRALGRYAIARVYLREARYAYERWGAGGKVRQLDAEMPDLLAGAPRPGAEAEAVVAAASMRSTTASQSVLDLRTVVKASQALSSEIVVVELLRKIMLIVIENAGAQRGVLLLFERGRLDVAAEGTVDGGAATFPGGKPVDPAELPASVIHYVARTGESVVLDDAIRGGTFGDDPYVRARGARSILALPVVQQGKSVGVLYVENNLAAGAFTPDRVEVLGLLCTQAAISLENGSLYHTLADKVAERTRELEAALARLQQMQERIIVQEKMASFGALTTGIAHEIRNPLNFICNFASLSAERLHDLREELRAGPSQDVDAELDSLEQNAQKICEHGERANRIVSSILAHAKPSSEAWESTDLHALLDAAITFLEHSVDGAEALEDIEVERRFDPAVGFVRVIPPDIGRALRNLIDNGVYAAAERGRLQGGSFVPRLRLATRRVPGAVEVRIRDNGSGVPAAVRDKIYKPFFTTKPPGQGVGLGLSMAHDIVVKQHGGSLDLETREGEFAEFIVTLPA